MKCKVGFERLQIYVVLMIISHSILASSIDTEPGNNVVESVKVNEKHGRVTKTETWGNSPNHKRHKKRFRRRRFRNRRQEVPVKAAQDSSSAPIVQNLDTIALELRTILQEAIRDHPYFGQGSDNVISTVSPRSLPSTTPTRIVSTTTSMNVIKTSTTKEAIKSSDEPNLQSSTSTTTTLPMSTTSTTTLPSLASMSTAITSATEIPPVYNASPSDSGEKQSYNKYLVQQTSENFELPRPVTTRNFEHRPIVQNTKQVYGDGHTIYYSNSGYGSAGTNDRLEYIPRDAVPNNIAYPPALQQQKFNTLRDQRRIQMLQKLPPYNFRRQEGNRVNGYQYQYRMSK